MNAERFLGLLAASLVGLSTSGCIIGGTRVWTQKVTETRLIGSDVSSLEVETHNGRITYEGQANAADASVVVTKRAGGRTKEEAQKAFDSLEVFVESLGNGHYSLGWRWAVKPKPSSWQADVGFEITGPAKVRIDAETHNGTVRVANVEGEVIIETHNGEINVSSTGSKLEAETHNGSITASFGGGEIELMTHNGEVVADLSQSGGIRGEISTHNGAVQITVSDRTSANVNCTTHNGRISFDPPMLVGKVGRTHVEGKLGAGGAPLEVTTHNGSIRFKKGSG